MILKMYLHLMNKIGVANLKYLIWVKLNEYFALGTNSLTRRIC